MANKEAVKDIKQDIKDTEAKIKKQKHSVTYLYDKFTRSTFHFQQPLTKICLQIL